jgi:hypothetical protein
VARQALAISRLDIELRPAPVNGAVGTVTLRDARPFAIAGFTIRTERASRQTFSPTPSASTSSP